MKRKMLDRLLGDWVLLEVVSEDGQTPTRVEGFEASLALGRVVEHAHGARPIRADHDVLFDVEQAKRVTFEDELVQVVEGDRASAHPKPFALVPQSALVSLIREDVPALVVAKPGERAA